MIEKDNLKEMLVSIGFRPISDEVYQKEFNEFSCSIIVDFNTEKIIYPEDKGLNVIRHTVCNFSKPENFTELECVNRLLEKGYRPENITLEKEWPLGHEIKGGYADICVTGVDGEMLFIIECKTAGQQYADAVKKTIYNGDQLFSYWQQERSCKWLILYSSDFKNGSVVYKTDSIDCSDDANIISSANRDPSIKLYESAHTVSELYSVWNETYEHRFCGDVIFRDDSVAYNIGIKPLRKKDLNDFREEDKIVNRFEEILRHNNVSDKENAFNRLIALFICKLVDEIQKNDDDIVEFQYKVGTDTYESLQDRLQRLHKEGMEKFMREEIYYVSDDYAEKLIQQYTGQYRQKMIDDLKATIRILKFYTNNDFAFKDVHNEELFYQNGKILVEVVQLFQGYRIIGSSDIQLLGDLFEQLLNKGFKQNEGQFFTPIPITRFMWDSLPLDDLIQKPDGLNYPRIIDYACGAGHFLTEGYEAINSIMKKHGVNQDTNSDWVEENIYGIEKDYRLARVSKISLFMHGAGNGNIIFGDGLENYPEKNIIPGSFDILIANPPYSVKGFKPHLKLKNNDLSILQKISDEGSEIETLFIERISQLVKPSGIAAVILPNTILYKGSDTFIAARESLLQNFYIRAMVSLGNKTFSATPTNTVVLFLQKFDEPPKRVDLIEDSVNAIYECTDISDWEDQTILQGYLKKIGVSYETYYKFVTKKGNYDEWSEDDYFKQYYEVYINSSDYKKKVAQKSFIRLTNNEQMELLNQKFYDYVFPIEKEKLFYYGLVYNQSTLIITAPNDSKEQEKFLGYKWNGRRGQEGIQIINAGGMLYNDKDRYDDMTLAGMIRNSFAQNIYDVEGMEEYYYYLHLQDMIDFYKPTFNKAIKTTRTRVLKDTPGLTNFRLSDSTVFDLQIGDRVLSTEINEEGGTPVYSANVYEKLGFINKQNITNFSKPSIIWGIDGDWMVNILPANKPFYPTDHCGVMRIYSDKILPEYMALALQVEGEYERFSRTYRASLERVKDLIIQVPEMETQKNVVKEISAFDEKIIQLSATIRENLAAINKIYEDVSKTPSCKHILLREIATCYIGLTYTPDKVSESGIPVLRSCNISNSFLQLDDITRVDMQINDLLYVKDNDILMCSRNGSANLVGKVALIHDLPEPMTFGAFMTIIRSQYNLYLWSYFQSDEFRDQITGGKTMSINEITTTMLDNVIISLPEENLIQQYNEKVTSLFCTTEKIMIDRENVIKERDAAITKYFR